MYDRDWAEDVFESFYQRHVLAAHEINRLYCISIDAVILSIQEGSERWRGYKSLVKHAEKAIRIYWKHFHSGEGVSAKYLTFDKYLKEQFRKRSFPAPYDLVDTKTEEDLSW